MKRAALALFCAASLVAFSGLSGCSNSSGGGAPFVPQTTTTNPTGGGQPAASLPREAAGKKYDAMAGEWVFDRSICPWNDSDNGTAAFYFDSIVFDSSVVVIYSKTYPDQNGNTPKSLTIADRSYTLVVHTSSGEDKSLSCGSFKAFDELGDRGHPDVKKCAKDYLNVDLASDDVFVGTKRSDYDGAFLKLVSGELYFICDYSSCITNTACLVFRKKGSSPSGGGSGTVSFSLQGNWKKKGDTQNGRWIVGYTASVLSVSDKFAVSGSASEMKWTLEKSSYVTGGQTYEDTTSSAALQALWDIMGSEVTLVPYN